MAQIKSQNKSKSIETEEIALVTVLRVESVIKDPNLLYEAMALSPYIALTKDGYQLFMKSEEVAYISIDTKESPHLIISFRNGRTEDIG